MEGRSEGSSRGGSVAEALSSEIVRLTKRMTGRGPEKCRTHVLPDCVLVLMRHGHTVSEGTMAGAGQERSVAQTRVDIAEGERVEFVEAVERLTGRRVESFLTSSHQDPSILAHVYVFAADKASGESASI